MKKIGRILNVFTIFVVLLLMVTDETNASFKSDGVAMQIKMVLQAGSGELVNGQKDVMIRLKNDADELLWERVYQRTIISNGELDLKLEGVDGNELSVDVFDQPGVWLEVQIDEEILGLNIVTEPYAIKSRISDSSRNAMRLLDVPIRDSDVMDGDVLTYEESVNEWVPKGEDDGLTGVTTDENRIKMLEKLSNVDIRGINEGEVLKYSLRYRTWQNKDDEVLTKDDVRQILQEKGYLKDLGMSALSGGMYEQIKGVGGTIRIKNDDDLIEINSKARIKHDALLESNLGTENEPIGGLFVQNVNIGNNSAQDNAAGIEITEADGELLVNSSIKIDDKFGRVLSGLGKKETIGLFASEDELFFSDELKWSHGLRQFGVGSLCEFSGCRSKLNVEGTFRINGDAYIGDDLLSFDDYVKRDELFVKNYKKVAISGDYRDLKDEGKPDISDYIIKSNVESYLRDNYYLKANAKDTIFDIMNEFVMSELDTIFRTELSDYQNTDDSDDTMFRELENYDTKLEHDNLYIDTQEFADELDFYVIKQVMDNDILGQLMRKEDLKTVGRTGHYVDLEVKPDFLLNDQFLSDKKAFESAYVTKEYVRTATTQRNDVVKNNTITNIEDEYITMKELLERQYASQQSVDDLHMVASSGRYNDLENRPDWGLYEAATDIDAQYIDESEMDALFDQYIKSVDVKRVGKTGLYDHIIDAPDIGQYLTRSVIDDTYVSMTYYTDVMNGKAKTASLQSMNLSEYAKTSEMISSFNLYTKTADYHAVALSGKYSDLEGLDNIINQTKLDKFLSNYIKKSDLQEMVDTVHATYDNAEELSARLTNFLNDAEQGVEKTTSDFLSNNYDTKDGVNNKITLAIEEYITNTMNSTIATEAAKKSTVSFLNQQLALGPHKTKAQIKSDMEADMSNYYTKVDMVNERFIMKQSDARIIETSFSGINNSLDHGLVPKGGIIMWSGSSVPSGWALCNGANGTPNLSGKFIVGYDPGYADYNMVGKEGGAHTINLTTHELPEHNHTITNVSNESTKHTHTPSVTVNTAPHNHGSSMALQDTNHTHSGSVDQKDMSHGHNGNITGETTLHDHGGTSSMSGQAPHTHTLGGVPNHTHPGSTTAGTNGSSMRVRHKAKGPGGQYWIDGGHSLGTDNHRWKHFSHQHTASNTNSAGAHRSHSISNGGSHGGNHTVVIKSATTSNHGHSMTIDNNTTMASHEHSTITLGNELNKNTGATQKHYHTFTVNNDGASNHTGSKASHNHNLTISNQLATHKHSVSIDNSGSSSNVDNRPQYYVLAFLMKVVD